MKKEASQVRQWLKNMLNALRGVVKAKSMSLRSRGSALKTRLIIFSLLRVNKKVLLGSLSDKLHSLLHPNSNLTPTAITDHQQPHAAATTTTKAMVVYEQQESSGRPAEHIVTCTDLVAPPDHHQCYQLLGGDDDKYPDWTHSMFDDDESSVIDLVRNAKDNDGEEFRLEDEIDHVADLFIRRFHRHVWLEKQQSLNRRCSTALLSH